MPAEHADKVGWIGWTTFAIGVIATGVSMYLGDVIFICLKYGRHAYFVEGLRFIKHKPYTLSTGEVLSQGVGSLIWLLSIAIWLTIIVSTAFLLIIASRLFRRLQVRSSSALKN